MGWGCPVNDFLVACVSAKLHSKMRRKDKNRVRVGKKKNKKKAPKFEPGGRRAYWLLCPHSSVPSTDARGLEWMGQTADTQRRGPGRAWSLGLIKL